MWVSPRWNASRTTRKGARGNQQIWGPGHFLTASRSFSPDHMRGSLHPHLSMKASADEGNNLIIKKRRQWARAQSSRDFHPTIVTPPWGSLPERLSQPQGEETHSQGRTRLVDCIPELPLGDTGNYTSQDSEPNFICREETCPSQRATELQPCLTPSPAQVHEDPELDFWGFRA